MKYARIKQGALVSMDFSAYHWPSVPCPLREQTLDMLESKLGSLEVFTLMKFFDRVFEVDAAKPTSRQQVTLRADGFGVLSNSREDDLYGKGALYVTIDNTLEATEAEFLKSKAEVTAYVKSLARPKSEDLTKGSLLQLIKRTVSEKREIQCRRTQVQSERYPYAFIVLKPSLEMFEDDNCDGGGYRTWTASMEDMLAEDWYEITQVDLKEDGNVVYT